jgi:hypothetical protein
MARSGSDSSVEINPGSAQAQPLVPVSLVSSDAFCSGDDRVMCMKRKRDELELLKLKHEVVSGLVADYEKICTNTAIDEHAKTVFKDTYLKMLAIYPPLEPQCSSKTEQTAFVADVREKDVFGRFMLELVDTKNATQTLAARVLYDKYVDFHTGASVAQGNCYMLTETSFCKKIKEMPGVFKKRTSTAMLYYLDHDKIKEHLLHETADSKAKPSNV